jgi:hypothetical protein
LPTAAQAGAKFAARKRAITQNHICMYEETLFHAYPRMSGSMRPSFGYYQPIVQSPRSGYGSGGTDATSASLMATVASFAKSGMKWFAVRSGGAGKGY